MSDAEKVYVMEEYAELWAAGLLCAEDAMTAISAILEG